MQMTNAVWHQILVLEWKAMNDYCRASVAIGTGLTPKPLSVAAATSPCYKTSFGQLYIRPNREDSGFVPKEITGYPSLVQEEVPPHVHETTCHTCHSLARVSGKAAAYKTHYYLLRILADGSYLVHFTIYTAYHHVGKINKAILHISF